MKSVKINGSDTALVWVDPEDKRYYNIHTGNVDTKLWLYNEANKDGRVAQPTTGIILSCSCDTVREGDYVLFHHNACMSTQLVKEEDGKKLYRISVSLIMGKCPHIPEKMEDISPVYPSVFVDRMYEDLSTKHIVAPFKSKKVNYMKVWSVPAEIKDVKKGNTVVVYDKSDYEMNYNLNGSFSTIIKVNYEADIIGVVHAVKER